MKIKFVCEGCKREVKDSGKYCIHCGRRFVDEQSLTTRVRLEVDDLLSKATRGQREYMRKYYRFKNHPKGGVYFMSISNPSYFGIISSNGNAALCEGDSTDKKKFKTVKELAAYLMKEYRNGM